MHNIKYSILHAHLVHYLMHYVVPARSQIQYATWRFNQLFNKAITKCLPARAACYVHSMLLFNAQLMNASLAPGAAVMCTSNVLFNAQPTCCTQI